LGESSQPGPQLIVPANDENVAKKIVCLAGCDFFSAFSEMASNDPRYNQKCSAKQNLPKNYESMIEHLRNCRIAEANAVEQPPPANPQIRIRPAMAGANQAVKRGQYNEQMRSLKHREEDRAARLQQRLAANAPTPRQIPVILVPNPGNVPPQPSTSKCLTDNITDTGMCSPKASHHWHKRILGFLNQTKTSKIGGPSEQHKETKASRKGYLKFIVFFFSQSPTGASLWKSTTDIGCHFFRIEPIVRRYNWLTITSQIDDSEKYCKICDLFFSSNKQLAAHLNGDKSHNRMLRMVLDYFDLL
jgi:Zinc-finger double-stranded RNA-binding